MATPAKMISSTVDFVEKNKNPGPEDGVYAEGAGTGAAHSGSVGGDTVSMHPAIRPEDAAAWGEGGVMETVWWALSLSIFLLRELFTGYLGVSPLAPHLLIATGCVPSNQRTVFPCANPGTFPAHTCMHCSPPPRRVGYAGLKQACVMRTRSRRAAFLGALWMYVALVDKSQRRRLSEISPLYRAHGAAMTPGCEDLTSDAQSSACSVAKSETTVWLNEVLASVWHVEGPVGGEHGAVGGVSGYVSSLTVIRGAWWQAYGGNAKDNVCMVR